MVVGTTIVLICIGAFLCPKKYIDKYFFGSAIMLSALYFFFSPPIDYDLYRHYLSFEAMKDRNFGDVISFKQIYANNLLNEYAVASKVYMIILYIISRFKIPQLLPFVAGLTVYILSEKTILKTEKVHSVNRVALVLAFCYLLCCVDFRSISGIRNIMAFSILAFSAYQDLVLKKNRPGCWIGYLLACGIHISCVVFVGIRFLLLIKNRFIKYLLLFVSFFAYNFSDVIVNALSSFTNIPILYYFTGQIRGYSLGRSEYNANGIILYLMIEIAVILLYLCVWKNGNFKSKIGDYGQFCLCVFLFAIGGISNYDLFLRSCMLVSILFLPIIVYFFSYIAVFDGTTVRFISEEKNKVFSIFSASAFIVLMLFCFFMLVRTNYIPMDNYFGSLF